jgi:hypothetical protein
MAAAANDFAPGRRAAEATNGARIAAFMPPAPRLGSSSTPAAPSSRSSPRRARQPRRASGEPPDRAAAARPGAQRRGIEPASATPGSLARAPDAVRPLPRASRAPASTTIHRRAPAPTKAWRRRWRLRGVKIAAELSLEPRRPGSARPASGQRRHHHGAPAAVEGESAHRAGKRQARAEAERGGGPEAGSPAEPERAEQAAEEP